MTSDDNNPPQPESAHSPESGSEPQGSRFEASLTPGYLGSIDPRLPDDLREPCGSDPDSGECADSGCGGLLSSEVIRKGYRWSSFTILQSLLRENAQARHAIALLLFRQSLILRAISAIGVCAVAVQGAGENLSSVGFFHARHLFGRALGNYAAAFFAAFGAEINDPVGLFNDVEIMLDDQYRVAERDKAVENVEKFFYVVEMQPGGGLIENV